MFEYKVRKNSKIQTDTRRHKMIVIVGKKEDSEKIVDIPNDDLANENIEWHWTHFEDPTAGRV